MDPELIGIPVIVAAELWTGVKKNVATHPRQAVRLQEFLSCFFIADFNLDAAMHYAEIRARLEAIGKKIGPLDLLIAAQARSLGQFFDRQAAAQVLARVVRLGQLLHELEGQLPLLLDLCLELGASRRGALRLAFCYGVGTYALPLMKTFGAEPGTALLVVAATWLAFKARRTGRAELFANLPNTFEASAGATEPGDRRRVEVDHAGPGGVRRGGVGENRGAVAEH